MFSKFLSLLRGEQGKLLLVVSIASFVAVGLFYVFYSGTTFDEGNFLYKGYLYASGKEKPYSLGGTWSEYMPGGFFIFGLTQLLFGINFYIPRLLSFFIGLLTVFLVYFLTKKLIDSLTAILAVSFMVLNLPMIQFFSTISPYSLSSFFLILSLVIINSNKKDPIKILLSLMANFASVFVRASMIPSYVFFVLYLIFVNKRNKKISSFIIFISLLVPILMLFPFSPGIFNIFFQLPGIRFFAVLMGYPKIYFLYFYNYKLDIGKIVISFLEFFKYYQVWFVPLFSLLFLLIISFRKNDFFNRFKKEFSKNDFFIGFILILFAANIIVHFVGAYDHCPRCVIGYFNYFSPLGAVILAILLGIIINRSKDKVIKDFSLVFLMTIIFFLTSAVLSNLTRTDFANTSIQEITKTSLEIKKLTQPNDKIFLLGDPQYLYISERQGFGPLINKEYSLRPSGNSEQLKKVGFWDVELAEEWMRESDWALVSDQTISYLKSSESPLVVGLVLEQKINKYFTFYRSFEDPWRGTLRMYAKKEGL